MKTVLVALELVALAGCAAPRRHYHFSMPPTMVDVRLEPRDAVAAPHVTVLGQVQHVGAIRYCAGLTVVGAIAASGGLTELASDSRIDVTRIVGSGSMRYRVSVPAIFAGDQPDFLLRAGDIVDVGENYF